MEIQEKEIIKGLKRREQKAFKYLYDSYSKALLNTSYRITKIVSDSEDILQEVFITAFNSIISLKKDQV